VDLFCGERKKRERESEREKNQDTAQVLTYGGTPSSNRPPLEIRNANPRYETTKGITAGPREA